MRQIHIQYHKTRCAEFVLGSCEDSLCLLDFRYRRMRRTVDNRLKAGLDAQFVEQDTAVLQETRRQLEAYLAGERTEFTQPLLLVGSTFQKQVWQSLLKVPYGARSTYLQLAETTGNRAAVRAVAAANGANAIALVVPCHRIIGSDGSLTGYGGGLRLKQQLLDMEQQVVAANSPEGFRLQSRSC